MQKASYLKHRVMLLQSRNNVPPMSVCKKHEDTMDSQVKAAGLMAVAEIEESAVPHLPCASEWSNIGLLIIATVESLTGPNAYSEY